MKHIDERISSHATEAEIYATTYAFSLDIFVKKQERSKNGCISKIAMLAHIINLLLPSLMRTVTIITSS